MNPATDYETEKAEIARVKESGEKPTLLLHSCCAPCSSAVLEKLTKVFSVTVFYYNPNISPAVEYEKRLSEERRFCESLGIPVIAGEYEPAVFTAFAEDKKDEKEGGARCALCYRMRLEKTANLAKEKGFAYFCSTLSVSPYKNAKILNGIGRELEKSAGVKYLVNDFKKENGYLRSIELSKEYGLYRQDYCGCVYSQFEREKEKKEREKS